MMDKKQIVLSPPIKLFCAACGRQRLWLLHEAYITDTIVNGRVLVRSVYGNGPAGWLKIRKAEKPEE